MPADDSTSIVRSSRSGTPLKRCPTAVPYGAATSGALRCGEEPGDFRRALGVQLHDIAGAQLLEEPLHVLVPQPDAAVRFREADRAGLIGAVDPVALRAETDPAGADRIAGAGLHDLAARVVGRIRHAIDDAERADGTGRNRRADRDRID